jgi:large subunit ribosomal protein L29
VIDIAEVRDMGEDEIYSRLAEAKQEMFNLRFQHVTGQLDNYSRLSDLKKDIARLKTILREREIEAAERPEGAPEATAPDEPEPDDSRRGRRARVAASRKAEADPKGENPTDDESTTPEENGG